MIKKNKNGFSLIEILISLGIISSLTYGIFILVPKVQSQIKINETSSQLFGMVMGLKSIFGPYGDYNGLNTKVAINSRLYYDNMQAKEGHIYNTWNGFVYFGHDVGAGKKPRYKDDLPSRRYMITYTNVPNMECSRLSTGAGSNFSLVIVNGNDGDNVIINKLPNAKANLQKADINRALDQCNQEGILVDVLEPDKDNGAKQMGNVIQFIGY